MRAAGGRRRRSRRLLLLLALVGLGLVASCSRLGYYAHSLAGGARILASRRPVAAVLDDPATPPRLARRLETARAARSFAVAELGLPDNGSYTTYVELDRPYAVWNVVAAPELSVEPVTWCFPFAGCVSYRGYFSRRAAERFAARLAARSHDVEVAGVAAYSTLGWFADPLLSTFVAWPEPDLAGLLFHELAHQRLYAPGDTTFNESFAMVVELAGVDRWLAARGLPEQAADYHLRRRRQARFVELALASRERLAALYAAPVPDAEKRERKAGILARLEADYRTLRASWGDWPGYDAWFEDGVDNADLAALGAYHRLVGPLERVLEAEGGDLEAFYRAAEELAEMGLEERWRALGVEPESGPSPEP